MTAARSNEPAPQPHVGLASEGDSGRSDPDWEELYQRACAVLAQKPAPSHQGGRAALALLTMLLFAGVALWQIGFNPLALTGWLLPLIGVLLLHEAGHYAGMRLFRYHDLRMFFIPFFGAAVSGQKHAAPAWQQATVLLLGPLPGIVLGVLLTVFHPTWLTIPVAFLLLVINGFNLLPLFPLDGGKLLHVLLFSRQPLWETVLLAVSGVGLGVLGWLEGWWVLGVLAVALLVGVPVRYRERQQRVTVRRELPELPAELSALSELERRALFSGARFLKPDTRDPGEYASEMKTLHEEAVTKPTALIATLALLALYAGGTVVVLWSLSCFFFWGEGPHPGEWSPRRIEALVNGELKLDEITLTEVAPGRYTGTGQSLEGTKWTLKVEQDRENKRLTWSATSDDGKRRVGRLTMSKRGVLVDETPR